MAMKLSIVQKGYGMSLQAGLQVYIYIYKYRERIPTFGPRHLNRNYATRFGARGYTLDALGSPRCRLGFPNFTLDARNAMQDLHNPP